MSESRFAQIWPGLVWAVPLAALIIVSYLGIHALTHRGEIVTVTFTRAADARAGDTKVLYQGVETGELVKIVPNADGRRLDFKLRLDPTATVGLNTNARFWLIGATPSLSDLSSLKAVVSGVAIGFAPGVDGTPTRSFEGLEAAPTVFPGDRGSRYVLRATTLGTVETGSPLLFHGFPIGKVTDVRFQGREGFRVEVFVFQPHDSLIKDGGRFWRASPVKLSFSGGSIDASLAPTSAILTGGIELEVPKGMLDRPQSKAGAEFTLYPSEGAARQGLSGPAFRYRLEFTGTAGDLEEEAPVTLLGFQVGSVETVHLMFEPATGQPYTSVTALLYPRQLVPEAWPADAPPDTAADATASAPAGPAGLREATDAKLRALLRQGFRARLRQTPALVGARSIALEPARGAPLATLDQTGAEPRIPTDAGGADIDELTSQAGQILAKVNRLPIDRIGQDLARATERLGALASSPQLGESLNHLHDTLAKVDGMMAEAQPRVGPLMIKLDQAAGELAATAATANRLLGGVDQGANDANLSEAVQQLSEAGRSVRSLSDYLSRHPEALLRGKRAEK